MKKKLYSLLVIISLLFSNIGFVYASEESIEETTAETTEQIPQENTPDEAVESPTSTPDTIPEDLPTRTAKLRIETSEGVLFEDSVTFSACKPYETSEEYTLNAQCLIEQTDGLDVVWTPGDDAWLDRINQYGTDLSTGLYWAYFANLEYGSVALNHLPVHEGDEVLLVYGVNPLKIEVDTLSPTLYTTTTVRVYEFGFDEFWSPVWLPSNSSTLLLDENSIAVSQNGEAILTFDTLDTQTLRAIKTGLASSNSIEVYPILPTTKAQLHVVAHGQTLFHDTIEVTACIPNETQTDRYTLNARCLIDQAIGITPTWSTYGTDSFLDSINGIDNNFETGLYWGYFINHEYASTALNQYILTEGDELLITYNTIPLKLTFSTTTPTTGDTVTVSLYEFGFDEFWSPAWLAATGALFTINGTPVTTTDHTYTFIPTTTIPYLIRAEKEGYITIEKTLVATTTQSTGESTENNEGTGGNGSSSGGNITNPVQRMIQFLDSTQNADGSFGSTPFLTDWAALAYGSWTDSSQGLNALKNYLISDPTPLDGPNATTNYARRSMALMALGINPYSGTPTNYIEKIISGFDGTQFGDTGLINDDIFALVPLVHAGYSNNPIVASTTKFIIENQSANGSFGSIDLTAAAIQALSPFSSDDNVRTALTHARTYLKNAQRIDAGFGDVYATGWVLQAISALGEHISDWLVNGISPVSYLTNAQASDGGLLSSDVRANRIWSTSYAIPGLLGTPWNKILASFEAPVTTPETSGQGSSTATTTFDIITPTTTVDSTTTSTPISPEITITENSVDTLEQGSTYTSSSMPTPIITSRQVESQTSIVRGERIIEDVESPTTPTNTPESALASDTDGVQTLSHTPVPITRYIFWSSFTALLLALGYSWFIRPTSKK